MNPLAQQYAYVRPYAQRHGILLTANDRVAYARRMPRREILLLAEIATRLELSGHLQELLDWKESIPMPLRRIGWARPIWHLVCLFAALGDEGYLAFRLLFEGELPRQSSSRRISGSIQAALRRCVRAGDCAPEDVALLSRHDGLIDAWVRTGPARQQLLRIGALRVGLSLRDVRVRVRWHLLARAARIAERAVPLKTCNLSTLIGFGQHYAPWNLRAKTPEELGTIILGSGAWPQRRDAAAMLSCIGVESADEARAIGRVLAACANISREHDLTMLLGNRLRDLAFAFQLDENVPKEQSTVRELRRWLKQSRNLW